MSNVQFEDNDIAPIYTQTMATPKASNLQKLVIKLGLAKTPMDANKILLLLAIIFLIFAIVLPFMFTRETNSESATELPPEVIQKLPAGVQQKINQSSQ